MGLKCGCFVGELYCVIVEGDVEDLNFLGKEWGDGWGNMLFLGYCFLVKCVGYYMKSFFLNSLNLVLFCENNCG